jgi:hypothetical protein
MDKVPSSFQTEIIIKEISKMDYLRAKVILSGKMDQSSQAFLKTERKMEKEY